ncbi:hypothetical protein H0H93_007643 [Arthromyces matolae]|nr:hypothetical protein H0H93_007643 [Arthromyces matolae]
MRKTALDAQRYDLARQEALSPDNSPAGTICHSLAGESDNDHSSNSSSTDVETEAAKPAKSPIDVNDKTELVNDYTCTIIRPQPRSGIFDVFSRPCSPISILSRPGSPMSFSTLNCFGSSDNFEDDVQILEVQRARRAEVKIIVTASKEVYSEKWDESTVTSPLLRRRTSLEIQLEEKMTEQMIEAQKRRARYYEGHREECSM